MNKLQGIIFICLILLSFNSFAQSPDLINYQAVAYNASGNSVANTAISIRITILQGSVSGPIAYQETHNPGTDANGAFDLQIGGGAVTSGTFAGISWGSFSHYLRVEMDISGGSSYTIMGTSQMVSVPYAKYAETAGSVGGAAASLNGTVYKVAKNCSVTNCSYMDMVSQANLFEELYTSKNPNTIIIERGTYNITKLTYNPTTLAVTAISFDSYSPTYSNAVSNLSATITADFDVITLSYTITDGGVCQCTNTYTRQ